MGRRIGYDRKEMRVLALTTAAAMVRQFVGGGTCAEEIDLSAKEFRLLEEENIRLEKILLEMADKIEQEWEKHNEK